MPRIDDQTGAHPPHERPRPRAANASDSRAGVAGVGASRSAAAADGDVPSAAPDAAARNGAPAKPGFALRPGEPLAGDLARVGCEQIDSITRRLRAPAVVDAQDVHESRKSLKRLRALTRLLRPALGSEAYQRENGDLRDAARHLAGARDAEVMVLTLDELLRHDRKQVPPGGYAALRAHLQAERERVGQQLLADAGPARRAAADLAPVRERAVQWLSADADFSAIEPGLRRIYREGRERYRIARREPSAENLHEWRKRVKDLRYCAELLAPLDQERLGKVCARTDRLGENLGDEHDLAVLDSFASDHPELFVTRAQRKRLGKLIRRRRTRLRRRALRVGGKLYGPRPGRFTGPLARRARAATPR